MNFKEWWKDGSILWKPCGDDVELAVEAAWNAALDEASKLVINELDFLDEKGLFLSNKILELKE